jgi:hypothetical protein
MVSREAKNSLCRNLVNAAQYKCLIISFARIWQK